MIIRFECKQFEEFLHSRCSRKSVENTSAVVHLSHAMRACSREPV